jgi:hypothetical protein
VCGTEVHVHAQRKSHQFRGLAVGSSHTKTGSEPRVSPKNRVRACDDCEADDSSTTGYSFETDRQAWLWPEHATPVCALPTRARCYRSNRSQSVERRPARLVLRVRACAISIPIPVPTRRKVLATRELMNDLAASSRTGLSTRASLANQIPSVGKRSVTKTAASNHAQSLPIIAATVERLPAPSRTHRPWMHFRRQPAT